MFSKELQELVLQVPRIKAELKLLDDFFLEYERLLKLAKTEQEKKRLKEEYQHKKTRALELIAKRKRIEQLIIEQRPRAIKRFVGNENRRAKSQKSRVK